MRTTLTDHSDPHKTVRQVLPYRFDLLPNMKICISKPDGNFLIVARADVERILGRDDLDVHRRRMYEAALEEWKKQVLTEMK